MLHITSGESVRIPETGLPGDVLYWMDVLHEGPVPPALALEELSQVRARFIADSGWGVQAEALAGFARRDAALARFAEHDEVVLWFEHDLYDQLQLVQILDWFTLHDRSKTRLSLICIGSFPGIGRFKGLGQLTGKQLFSLFDGRREIGAAEFKLAAEAWAVLRSTDPTDIEWLLAQSTDALPFLRGALTRLLEQFPSASNGLARTERQILEVLTTGLHGFDEVFLAEQDKEERVFLGENTFRAYLERLRTAREPLVEIEHGRIKVTPAGHAVLRGSEDAVKLNGIDRWLGGVHLAADAWRWDERHRKLLRKDPARANRG